MLLNKAIYFLEEKGIITNLIKNYSKKDNNHLTSHEIKTIIETILEHCKKEPFKNENAENFDIGVIYTKSKAYKKRKELGEIYTPKKIVNYILDKIKYSKCSDLKYKRVIDLSCGCGSFLEGAVIQSINSYRQDVFKHHKKTFIHTLKEAQQIINHLQAQIYGIDINPIACILCQINLHLKVIDIYQFISTKIKDFKPLNFKIFHLNAYRLSKLSNLLDMGTFDYVIGNPPYLFSRDIPPEHKHIIAAEKFESKFGQYDSYQLFIELGLKFLKWGGKLGFIIPDSILALSNRRIIRKYLYEHAKIKEICIVEESTFKKSVISNVILIVEKEEKRHKRENNPILVTRFDREQSILLNTIQQLLIKKWRYRFLINLKSTDLKILNHLHDNFPKIIDLIKNKSYLVLLNRGIELTKKGKVFFCEKCYKYFPLPRSGQRCQMCDHHFKKKHIETIIADTLSEIPEKERAMFKPYLYSLQRYTIIEQKYINVQKKGISYKDMEMYVDRIIIRQLSQENLICASYSREILLCSQSYYNLKIAHSSIAQFNNLYLLGVVNSYLLSYFFIKSFGSYKQLFPRILIHNIKNLPIKIPTTVKERKLADIIIQNVEKLLEMRNITSTRAEQYQKEINSLIFEMYDITLKERTYIMDFIATQKKR
ncbi:MAG: hypothetical protein BAJALOKI1v1_480002 [Promethearchaeota archaeon]|nr:MAG: hypothetical protein BAJALOKI1v1_480002 [Candidatus Lokiarchaeota archaeon]